MIRTKHPTKPKKKRKGGNGRPAKKPGDKLTPKEQAFADLYINDKELHKYECYMKAYPKATKKNAGALATELLRRVHVKHYIDTIQEKITKKIEIDLEYFIKGYQRIAKFDHRKLYDNNKKVKHIADLDDDTAMGLSSIEFGTYQKTIKRKINNKDKTIKKMKIYLKNIKTESRKAALDSMREMLNIGGSQSTGSPEEFVQAARGFADDITDAVPGGEL